MSKTVEPTLAKSAARGAGVTLAGQLGRIVVQLGGLLVLSRLLTPTQYGLLASILAVVGIGDVIRDFGLSSAAIQAKLLSRGQSNNLFWLNSAFGCVIAVAVFFLAAPIAGFFHTPELKPLTQALSAMFLINGLATQYRAQLNRDLRFGALAGSEIVGQLVGLGAAVVLAVLHFGVWALVGQQLITALVTFALLAIQSAWQPGLPSRTATVRPFVSYGFHLMGAQMLNYASQNVDSIVIGSRMGAAQLGLYNRAFQLLTLPLNQINAPTTRVSLPVLSRLADQPQKYREFLLTGQSVLIHVVVAAFAFGCAQAYPLVSLALGAKWMGVSPIFQVLAVAGVFQVCAYATYWVFLSKALTASNLRFALVYRPVAIVMIISGAFIGGVFGVAWAYAASTLFGWLFGLFWISRVSDAPVRGMLANGIRALVGYAFAGLASFAAAAWITPDSEILRLLAGAGGMILALGLVVAIWPAFRRDLLAVRKMAKLVRNR